MTQKTVEARFDLTKERAHELITNYGRPVWEKFLDGKITNGELVSAFVNLEELKTNEKCFLTSHCSRMCCLAENPEIAISEMLKRFSQ